MIEGDSSLLHSHSVARKEEGTAEDMRDKDLRGWFARQDEIEMGEIAKRIQSNSEAIRGAVEGIPREQQVQPDPTENVDGGGNIINFPSTPRPIR